MQIIFNIFFLLYFKTNQTPNNDSESFLTQSFDGVGIPLGISFYTIQQIMFLLHSLDQHWQPRFREYLLFVSFFPQLVAGPIVSFQEMIGQYRTLGKSNDVDYLRSCILLFKALVKKSFLVPTVSSAIYFSVLEFDNFTVFDTIYFCICLSIIIYFDFSSYSDFARGISLLFGLKLPENFNSPYRARNLTHFWRSWHITLGSFLKYNVYIPLGGSLSSPMKTYRNLFVVCLVSGLWHGVGLTFLIWGFMHGLGMIICRITGFMPVQIPKWIGIFVTFCFVSLLWPLFFVHEPEHLKSIYFGLFSFGIPVIYQDALSLGSVLLSLFLIFVPIDWIQKSQDLFSGFKYGLEFFLVCLLISLFFLCIFGDNDVAFIYFRF